MNKASRIHATCAKLFHITITVPVLTAIEPGHSPDLLILLSINFKRNINKYMPYSYSMITSQCSTVHLATLSVYAPSTYSVHLFVTNS